MRMSNEQGKPSISIDLIKKFQPKFDDTFLTEGSPTLISAKRRKSKIYSNRKTNQELIKDTHEDLIRYIDSVDLRVQDIIQGHEAEFLTAYQKHIKKVREEMEEIRRQSSNNASSEKAYLERIDCLEKELVIFREESLKLFGKICSKDKQIFDLSIRIKELQSDNQRYEKNAYFLTRKNKELQAFAAKVKVKMGESMFINQFGLGKRDVKSENKRYEISTPNSKDIKPKKECKDMRPFTSGKTSNNSTFYLRMESNKKSDYDFEISRIKQKLEEMSSPSKLVNIDAVMKIIQKKEVHPSSNKLSDNSSANPRFFSRQKRKSSYQIIESQIMKLKSQEFAERNEYLNIFKNCVEEIKKDIARRNNISSLNYFKENGPKSYLQFKKMDCYSILELLLRNDEILKKIYEMLFNS